MTAPSSFRLLGSAFATLLVLLLVSLPWSPHTKLTFAGMFLEICGIGMLGWDIVAKLLREARTRWGPAFAHLFRRTPRPHVTFGSGLALSGGGTLKAAVDVKGLEKQIANLIARVEHIELWRFDELPRELDERIERLRKELSVAFETDLVAVETRYLGVRITGLVVALAGSIVLAAANLL